MRTALALALLVHGIAHLPGFTVAWRLTSRPDIPHTTALLGGLVDIGEAGIRVVGVLWLAAAFGFAATAVAAFRATPSWWALTLGVAVCSLLLSILNWPYSRIGVALNLLLLAYLLLGNKIGWLPRGPA